MTFSNESVLLARLSMNIMFSPNVIDEFRRRMRTRKTRFRDSGACCSVSPGDGSGLDSTRRDCIGMVATMNCSFKATCCSVSSLCDRRLCSCSLSA